MVKNNLAASFNVTNKNLRLMLSSFCSFQLIQFVFVSHFCSSLMMQFVHPGFEFHAFFVLLDFPLIVEYELIELKLMLLRWIFFFDIFSI